MYVSYNGNDGFNKKGILWIHHQLMDTQKCNMEERMDVVFVGVVVVVGGGILILKCNNAISKSFFFFP
jgi:hypothetical protein